MFLSEPKARLEDTRYLKTEFLAIPKIAVYTAFGQGDMGSSPIRVFVPYNGIARQLVALPSKVSL